MTALEFAKKAAEDARLRQRATAERLTALQASNETLHDHVMSNSVGADEFIDALDTMLENELCPEQHKSALRSFIVERTAAKDRYDASAAVKIEEAENWAAKARDDAREADEELAGAQELLILLEAKK